MSEVKDIGWKNSADEPIAVSLGFEVVVATEPGEGGVPAGASITTTGRIRFTVETKGFVDIVEAARYMQGFQDFLNDTAPESITP